jgi:hypothetical protein
LVKLLLALASTEVLVSGLVEIYEQDFYSFLDMYIFRSRSSPSMRGGVGLFVSFFVLSPMGLMTIFYCPRFETPPAWMTRSLYIYPPVTG